MSTSLLYHGFGVRGYRYARTDFLEGEVVFTIEQDRDASSLLRLRFGPAHLPWRRDAALFSQLADRR